MADTFKPDNYNSVSPYFVVDGAQKMVDFLKQLFNATELRRYDNPDGTIMHVEVRIDDSVVMIGDSTANYPPNTHLMHIYVPDVDTTFKKALSLGCTAIDQPVQKDGDPDKRGMFSDFAGNSWAIGTQMSK
ncbi:MAG TPA: VOC family protein [Cyclobacteriaceae bacterium]|nr:VOC family protein [Cyclobacteriaceae bacterium]